MEVLFFWIAFSIAVGFYANSKGRSGIGFFALSLFLSPLIGLIAAAIALPRKSVQDERQLEFSDDLKKCPFCAEVIKKEALKCRFCGSDLLTAPKAADATEDKGQILDVAGAHGREVSKLETDLPVGNGVQDVQTRPVDETRFQSEGNSAKIMSSEVLRRKAMKFAVVWPLLIIGPVAYLWWGQYTSVPHRAEKVAEFEAGRENIVQTVRGLVYAREYGKALKYEKYRFIGDRELNEWLDAASTASKPSTNPALPSSAAWSEDFNMDITKALSSSAITGCGQYEYRSAGSGKYIVRCTRDGISWTEYLVNTTSRQVSRQ